MNLCLDSVSSDRDLAAAARPMCWRRPYPFVCSDCFEVLSSIKRHCFRRHVTMTHLRRWTMNWPFHSRLKLFSIRSTQLTRLKSKRTNVSIRKIHLNVIEFVFYLWLLFKLDTRLPIELFNGDFRTPSISLLPLAYLIL